MLEIKVLNVIVQSNNVYLFVLVTCIKNHKIFFKYLYLLCVQKAIEESKKTALQEERARRYANRMLQKTASPSTSTSSLENDNGVCSPSKHHQQSPAVPKVNRCETI